MRWAIVIVVVAGCVRTETSECADGTLCPSGTHCVAVDQRFVCATQDQLAACEGLATFDACAGDGRCYEVDDGHVCWPAGCANGFTDPEEQCDDRNNISEDGCSADCLSDETCGNGVIDPLFGELCDDANARSADGCSSRCSLEQPSWTSHQASGLSSYREGIAFGFDPRRGRLVAYGGVEPGPGSSNAYNVTTFEWDRGAYEVITGVTPRGRTHAALAYDDGLRRTVLFGGEREGQWFADTWQWSGTTWEPIDASGPSARAHAALAYDHAGERLVLFGGENKSEALADAWALRDGAWQRLPDGPKALRPALAFDPTTNVLVAVADGRHWELAGTTWTERGSTPADERELAWVVFEPASRRMLLLGTKPGNLLGTWAWDGQAWTELARETVQARSVRGVVVDAAHGRIIAITFDGLAVWDAAGVLSLVDLTPVPFDQRIGAAAAGDLRRRAAVVFGGNTGTRDAPALTNEQRVFDGIAWRVVTPSVRPSPRWEHAMAYDVARDRIVLFGGATATDTSDETWEWDGTAWTSLRPAASPSARSGHAMAYDRERERVVLVGGFAGGVASGETWEWDGTSWTQRSTGPSPLARGGAALAYDPIGGGVLLFGGGEEQTRTLASAETWRLTAAGWEELAPPIVPTPRARASLTWSAARRRLVLVGGDNADDGGIVRTELIADDTWEWDGARWRALASAPLAVTQHVAFTAPDGSGVSTLWGRTDLNRYGFLTHRWDDGGAGETCSARADVDGDTRSACDDPDCWTSCTPLCEPGDAGCPAGPACGDGTCSAIEQVWTCPADCGDAPVLCGDRVCDAGEDCSIDCP